MKIKLPSKYKDRRKAEYPPITAQLDMLWHGMDLDPSKRIEPFYSTIREIKMTHPKGQ